MAEILTNSLECGTSQIKKLLSSLILKIKQKVQDLIGIFWILKDVCFTYGNIIST